ncbi:MAG TPA: hypothetical protein PKE45_25620, partial [Caldilineaceae bacterium]|nr:hypothetical protein [Caldilineaceae bacterium]
MARQTIYIEWSIADESVVWQNADAVAPLPARQSAQTAAADQQLVHPLRILALVMFALLATAATARVPQPDQKWQIQEQIEAALQHEESVWRKNDAALFSQFLDETAGREWRRDWFMPWGVEPDQRVTLGIHVIDIEAAGALVSVQTEVAQPLTAWWRTAPYRELRFYRPSTKGWVRTGPDPAAWGQVRTLATPHFRFQFYEQDAAAILTIAERTELAYRRLYQLLGQTPAATPIRLTFVVAPDQVREFEVSNAPL